MSPSAASGRDNSSDLFWETLTVLRSTGQGFCGMSLNWNLCGFFSWLHRGSGFGGRPEVNALSLHADKGDVLPAWLVTDAVTLISWFVRVPSLRLLFLPLPTEESPCAQPHLGNGELHQRPWWGRSYVNYLEFFCMGGLFILHLFIYTSMYLH